MSALDKSLDDLILEKKSKAQTRGGGGGGRNERGFDDMGPRRQRMNDAGPVRRSDFLSRQPAAPFNDRGFNDRRAFGAFEDVRPVRAVPQQEGKVRVEGLDPAWEAKDVREIFQEQGHPIVRVFMHWDRSGRSMGSCEMTLDSVASARSLVNDMDGAEVDGFPLAISLVRGAATQQAPPVQQAPARGMGGGFRGREPAFERREPAFGGRDNFASRDAGRGSFGRSAVQEDVRGAPRGGGGKGRREGGGKGGDRLVSKEDLDAELDRF